MIGDIGKMTAPSGVGGITDMQPRMPIEKENVKQAGRYALNRKTSLKQKRG